MLLYLRPTTPLIKYTNNGTQASQTNRGKSQESAANLKKERFNGKFSKCSQYRARKIGEYIGASYARKLHHYKQHQGIKKPQLAFITLTYSKDTGVSDVEAKRKHLNTFLIQLCRQYPKAKYMWRAELQNSGRLHFHIIVNCYVSKEWVSCQWFKIQSRAGYVSMPYSYKAAMASPSTNVQGAKTPRGAINYTLKYICKDNGAIGAKGRQWGSNIEFNFAKGFVLQCYQKEFNYLAELVEHEKIQLKSLDYYTQIQMYTTQFIESFIPSQFARWLKFLDCS